VSRYHREGDRQILLDDRRVRVADAARDQFDQDFPGFRFREFYGFNCEFAFFARNGCFNFHSDLPPYMLYFRLN
jgi:hypothetical protein